jgi:hypothetical protein
MTNRKRILQRSSNLADEIIEVERLERPQRRDVAGVDEHRDLVVRVHALALALGHLPLLGIHEGVLRVRDAGQDGLDVVRPAGADLAQNLAHRAGGVGLIEDGEGRAAQAERFRLGAEHVEAEAVERADLELARDLRPHDLAHALVHLARGLVGEGHREDGARGRPALDEARHALRDDARLARACAGEHEERSQAVLDGLTLGGVQLCNHA